MKLRANGQQRPAKAALPVVLSSEDLLDDHEPNNPRLAMAMADAMMDEIAQAERRAA